MKNEAKQKLNLSISSEMKKEIEQMAKRKGVTKSQLVVNAIMIMKENRECWLPEQRCYVLDALSDIEYMVKEQEGVRKLVSDLAKEIIEYGCF